MTTIQVSSGQSIQAAINQAQPGDLVQVNAGSYTTSGMGISFPRGGITVLGVGMPTISNTWVANTAIFDIHQNDIIIDGFNLQYADVLISAANNWPAIQNIIVRNIYGKHCSHVVFAGNMLKHSLFENITADATGHNSLYIFGTQGGNVNDLENMTTHHVILKSCKVINAGHSGIDIYGMSGWLHDITIDGCYLNNANIFFHDSDTMYNILITRNEITGITNASEEAIQGYFRNSRLEFNYIHDNAGYGFEQDHSSSGVIFYANRIVRNGMYGVAPQGNTIFDSNEIAGNNAGDYKIVGWIADIKNAIGLRYTLVPNYTATMNVSYTDGRTFNGGLTSKTYTTATTINASAAGTLPEGGGTYMETISANKQSYLPGEIATVSFSGATNTWDWIALYKEGVPPTNGAELAWTYLDDTHVEENRATMPLITSGTVTFVMPLLAGNYYFELFSHEAADTAVVGTPLVSVSAGKVNIQAISSGNGKVRWNNDPGRESGVSYSLEMDVGTLYTITAIPDSGYVFEKWIDSNSQIYSTASVSGTASQNMTYTAYFLFSSPGPVENGIGIGTVVGVALGTMILKAIITDISKK